MAEESAVSFGPYAFTLAPAEAEAAAARLGLRQALNGGLLASHVAPLTAFVLIMAFASVLALTGLVSRRAGEITLMLAALAFMIQRLMTHLAHSTRPPRWPRRDRAPSIGWRDDGDLRRSKSVIRS